MNIGYIALHRQITENEFWFCERFTKAQAWIDILLLATHKPNTVFIRGIEINLKPGELCYSQLSLAKRWKWNFKTVKKFLDILNQRGMIQFSGGKITTVISIINWSNYQKNGEQNQPIKSISNPSFFNAKGEQLGEQKENNLETNNNDKNEKEYLAEFERFWDAYGKKLDRVKCLKKWTKLTEPDKEKIFSTLPNYISATPDIKYRKNPFTYLNGECWNDEITQTNLKQNWDYSK